MKGSLKLAAFNGRCASCVVEKDHYVELVHLLVILHVVDVLLQELKGREEDCVDGTRATHGDAQASIHVQAEKLDLYWWDGLAARVHQAVALIYTLGRVDRVCEVVSVEMQNRREEWWVCSQIMAQETIPQRPPATRTARGFEGVPSPPKLDKSCLLLS